MSAKLCQQKKHTIHTSNEKGRNNILKNRYYCNAIYKQNSVIS